METALCTLRAYLSSLLSRMAESDPARDVNQTAELLRDILEADRIDMDTQGRTLLKNALSTPLTITLSLTVGGPRDAASRASDAGIAEAHEPQPELAVPQGLANAPAGDRSLDRDPRLDRVIRELDRLERRRDFIWIGYVAKTLLPNMGFDENQARELLNFASDAGIIVLTKTPNPNNPEFPSTTIKLNRQHPVVHRALGSGRPPAFRPIKIRGGPLSEDIIRDRR